MAVSPLSQDPKVLYLYAGLSAVMIVPAFLFWFTFGKLKSEEVEAEETEPRQLVSKSPEQGDKSNP